MSSFPPPYPYFNGIIYDQAFFNQTSSSGLTLSQANAKYLQKTIPDTASALETFSAGIKADTINPTTTSGTIQIGQTATNTNVEVAAQVSRSTVLHLGDGNTSSGAIHIGNGNNSSNNINILNGNYAAFQTAGTVNILSGAYASGSFGGNMNLFTGSRGTLTIGNAVNNQILFQKQPQFNSGIIGDTIDALAITSNMTIGSTINGSGSITLGQSTTPISLAGATTISQGIKTNSISNVAVTDSLLLANTQTIGDIQIGNGATRSGGIVIGCKGTTPSSNTITIGSSSTTLTLQCPITPSYSISATTGAGVGKVGEFKKVSNGFGYAIVAGSATSIINISIDAGVWILTGGMTTGSGGGGYNIITFSLVNNALNLGLGAMNIPAYAGFTYNLSICNTFCVTITTTVYLVAQCAINDTWATPSITATRLA
jgi:hypothetical protein